MKCEDCGYETKGCCQYICPRCGGDLVEDEE